MNRCVRCGKEVYVDEAKVAVTWRCLCGSRMWKWKNDSVTVYHDTKRLVTQCPDGLLYVSSCPCDSDMDIFAVITATGFGGLAVLSGEEECK